MVNKLPSGKHTKNDIENGPVEIVDLPSYKIVIFHSYVKLPEGNGIKILPWDLIGYNGTVEIELPNGISMVLLFCRFWTCLTMKNGDLAGIQTLTNHSAIGISSKGSISHHGTVNSLNHHTTPYRLLGASEGFRFAMPIQGV